ncbi:MAG: ribosome biogenesis GTPase, partial [bacterium]
FYLIKSEEFGELQCKIKGKLFRYSRFNNQLAVGDYVVFSKDENNEVGLILRKEPRKSFLSRSRVEVNAEQVLAANVDNLLIVVAAKNPPFRNNLILRMLVAANVGNIHPILIVTKTDLTTDEELEPLIAPYLKNGVEVITSSTIQPTNLDELQERLENSVSVVAGHSGVGKSSILNQMFPHLDLRVGDLITRTERGAHTTTAAHMHNIAPKGYVIDTPGIREYGLWKIDRNNLDEVFPAFENHLNQCKYQDCNHMSEPQCVVKNAIKDGEIDPIFYEGYQSIFASLDDIKHY